MSFSKHRDECIEFLATHANGCFDGSITLECDEVLEDSHHTIKQSCKDSAHFAEDSIGADLARYNSIGAAQEVTELEIKR